MEEKKEVVAENTEVQDPVSDFKRKVILKNPIIWDKVEYKKLEFDISELTGRDLIEIQTDMKLSGIPLTSSMSIDEAYIARIAAKASGVDLEVVEALKFPDFRAVINKISGLMF